MKEIGGYFGLEEFSGTEYHHNLIAVNSGRNALQYILQVRRYKKLYIPRFLCDSVAKLCERENCAYEEYAVGADFLPIFDGQVGHDEAFYLVNYYGQISDAQMLAYKARFGNLIFDNVQDFFRKPVAGVDTVYSCRKFFGVPDGGYAACDGVEQKLTMDESCERMVHVLGRFEREASLYYSTFQDNDESFYDMPLREMSRLTRNILRAVDYDAVREKRNRNYRILEQALGGRNSLRLTMPDGPYCYPFYCKNGMAVKRALAQKKIYVATLWPNVLEQASALEKDYAQNILPLPVDQRYGEAEMRRIIESM